MVKIFNNIILIGLFAAILVTVDSCGQAIYDSNEMKEHARRLTETSSFQYPLDDYFPETPVTDTYPPHTKRMEKYHAAEDCFAPPGTPVYAIGDGIISYSGKMSGYGWLIIIDHPVENVYSLYGHLSKSRWKKSSGEVKKGELIAYLAEAEEGETMVSHIHFGLRIGQRADYPINGDARWMAGHINTRPELLGWFHPSQIIGQTDTMKAWHKYLQKREDISTNRTLHAIDFMITSGRYSEKNNLDQMIVNEFGDSFRLADWKDIMTFSEKIQEWADSIGLVIDEGENALMVSNDGYRIWNSRQFIISRFDHNKPKHYLSHDAINDDFVCLGSWYGLNMHILAVKK
jgi:murein DD-endopeptidase MepM/ murein hydrolase activator NlpD